MLAPALSSAPFAGAVMQAFVVGSAYGARQSLKAGVVALRCVAKHFPMHFAFDPVNFARVLPTLAWHFASSLVRPGVCASTGAATRHSAPAATTSLYRSSIMSPSFCLGVCLWRVRE